VRSSDLARARETAELFAGAAGLEVRVDPRLREYDVGARSGLTVSEFEATFPAEYAAWLAHDETVLVDGEETTEQVRARVLPALQECLDELAPGETGLVVMHGACLKVGLLAVLGLPYEHARAFRGMENCAWAVLGEHALRRGMVLVSYNETATGGEHPTQALGADFASDEAVG
jgi:probable phosphoglycerate mutase